MLSLLLARGGVYSKPLLSGDTLIIIVYLGTLSSSESIVTRMMICGCRLLISIGKQNGERGRNQSVLSVIRLTLLFEAISKSLTLPAV